MNKKGFTLIEVVIVIVALFIGIGWILNIAKLTQCDFEPSYKAEIIRTIGILPPVGGIVGWMDIGK